MKTVRELCQRIAQVIVDKPVCVETGTMYTCGPGNEVHTTTNNIMEFICGPKDGVLHSLEIDVEHVKFAQDFCDPIIERVGGSLVHHVGDSADVMIWLASQMCKDDERVDLLCLDGKEFDEPHMVKEFEAIKDCLAEKHFVFVDDIHNSNSVKWKLMVPILKELDYNYVEVPTPTGMFVAWKGYEL